MKKLLLCLVCLVPLIALANSFSVVFIPLPTAEPVELAKHSGSKTKGIDYTVLSSGSTGTVAVLANGWLFGPADGNTSLESTIEITSDTESYERKVSLSKIGMYYTLSPFLIVFPAGYRLKIMGVTIEYEVNSGITEESMNELDFQYLNVSPVNRNTFGVEMGQLKAGSFKESPFLTENPVIIVKAGARPTGGYVLSLEEAILRKGEVYLKVKLVKPGKSDFVTQAFTYPHLAMQLSEVEPGFYTLNLEMIVVVDGEVVETVKFSDQFFVE